MWDSSKMMVYKLLVGLWTYGLKSSSAFSITTLDEPSLLLLPSVVKRKLESRRGRSVSPTQSCDPAADIFQPYCYEWEAFGARLGLWKNSFLGKIANQKVYKQKFITMAGWFIGEMFSDLNQKWFGVALSFFFLCF